MLQKQVRDLIDENIACLKSGALTDLKLERMKLAGAERDAKIITLQAETAQLRELVQRAGALKDGGR